MLRRPPTSISLSNRDIKEHLEHINQRKTQEGEEVQPNLCSDEDWNQIVTQNFGKPVHHGSELQVASTSITDTPHTGSLPGNNVRTQNNVADQVLSRLPQSLIDSSGAAMGPCKDLVIEEGDILIGFADTSERLNGPPTYRHQEYSNDTSSPSIHAFDYGGFMEANVNDSPLLAPEDYSIPQNSLLQVPETLRVASRVPIPLSPLTRSPRVNSPDRRPIVSLTPRVASYGTPGLLLSQPARRRKNYRPRTISYSFEESERASAAYEDIQGSDNDSNSSGPRPVGQMSLREELRGSSLQSASAGSIIPTSPPEFADSKRSISGTSQAAEQAPDRCRIFLSSAQFRLPPPFSAVPRNLSFAASLPSAPGDETEARNPSPVVRGFVDNTGQSSPANRAEISDGLAETEHSSPASTGTLRNLATLPFRLFSAYRSRSPLQSHSGASSSGSSPSLRRSPGREPPVTPRPQLRVYNDQLAASLQPQTPQNLPEAQHQSRYHPSFTAPPGQRFESPHASRSRATRGRGTRSNSPPGLETTGFSGLYGGQENADDEMMFDRAARRLWALSSARISGAPVDDAAEGEYR